MSLLKHLPSCFKGSLMALGLTLAGNQAQAAPPPPLQTQAPGYQRLAVGEYEVTALFDGYSDLGPTLLKGLSQKDIRAMLERKFIFTPGMPTAFNAFLINTGKNLVLVDAGAGACFGGTAGWLPDNIRAAGYQPEQVDTVLLTHMHVDHVCGLINTKDEPVFANATVYAANPEADYWLSQENLDKAPKDARGFFEVARKSVAPYVAVHRFKTFTPEQSLVPGVTAVSLPGHTPGSSGYTFSSNGQSILFMGDLVHSFAVQFQHPEVSIGFDVQGKQAVVTREKLFKQVAHDRTWVAGAHLPFPGIGHISGREKAFAWVPVEYGPYQRPKNVPLIQ
ncbi:MBL fold metallo-hydrolase [Pseudomonas frederiksbergensis]|jgi:glyoxylase-like metal-dependent hydrolase (beta-lactamase superfamily II)|uniref:MBL fold metallo-hydrolase n=1 Tax=Pseudomonas frederiksbergensis TaxID=104087 RepID=UPI003D209F7B